MKQITNTSGLVNQLEKMFKLLNADIFNNELEIPIITVTHSSRSYAHYTPWDAWQSKAEHRREINIASGTLNRPLEAITASLVHEMVHMYNDTVLNIQDVSRGNTYHNKYFAKQAEQRGLIVTRSDKYGYAHTAPSDRLIEWLLDHDELRKIELCRTDLTSSAAAIDIHSSNIGMQITGSKNKQNSRCYICPQCHTTVRATRIVNIICGDCLLNMTED